jgi:hypothetical protein
MSAKAKTKVLPTLVTFLLDKSGSMSSIWDSTIEGFNEYLKGLQAGGDAIKFTRLQFDSNNSNRCEIQKDCVAEPVMSVKPLDKISFIPRGMTPLIEACHKTINAVEQSLSKFDKKHQVIVCFQTDGGENHSSPEYTWDGLKKLIEEKTKAGWVFNFMGTGIDAYNQASKMGVAASNTMSTGTSREHVRSAFASASASNMRFAASGLMSASAYSPSERFDSGEHTIHHTLQPLSPPVDLSPGNVSPISSNVSSGDLDLTR